MTEIILRESALVEAVNQVAEREGLAGDDFVAEAVRHRLAVYRQKRIWAETETWYALPAETRKQFSGKFVAMFEGKVVDTDPDRLTLYYRIRERLGRRPVLIVEGGAQAMPVYRIRSPRHARGDDAR
ncbi:MAG: hypothetical protein HZC40_08350 [Chloroflexi bacterium]|nr:hypothetical protein [Chloroflexota bacterium]